MDDCHRIDLRALKALRAILDLKEEHKKTSDGTACFEKAIDIAKSTLKEVEGEPCPDQ
jgi:hypothetical protein